MTPPVPPTQSYIASPKGVDFIARHEVFRSSIYLDQAKFPTIGYGHKLEPGEAEFYRSGITREAALQLLRDDVGIAEAAVRNNVRVSLSVQQFDALVAFTFNAGAYGFRTSKLLRLLNRGDYNGAADQMLRWNKIKVKKPSGYVWEVSRGLVNRRNFERNLFLNGTYR